MRIGILGGGVSGVTVASLLKEKSIPFILFEKEPTLGGLMRSRITNGFVFDISGGHVFNSKYGEVKEFLFRKLPPEKMVYTVRNAKILYRGKMISYPFELALGEIDPEDAASCIISLLKRKGKEPNNFRDWLIWRYGREIASRYLIPYNKKIWKYPLHRMEASWAKQDKIPIPDEKAIIVAALKRDASERNMPHSTFYYPRTGGSQSFINAIASNLDHREICLNSPVKSLEKRDGSWIINGSVVVEKIVSTIPLKEFLDIMPSLPVKVQNAIEGLKYNSVTSLFFDMPPDGGLSWFYVPGEDLPFHRVVFLGNFSPENAPKGKNSAIVEFTGKETPEHIEAAQRHIGRKLIDKSHTEMAYVVYDSEYSSKMKIINRYFDSIGLPRVGRFATWRYLNFDVCMHHAMNTVREMFPCDFK